MDFFAGLISIASDIVEILGREMLVEPAKKGAKSSIAKF